MPQYRVVGIVAWRWARQQRLEMTAAADTVS
jgi:hypothetical protein